MLLFPMGEEVIAFDNIDCNGKTLRIIFSGNCSICYRPCLFRAYDTGERSTKVSAIHDDWACVIDNSYGHDLLEENA